MTEQRQRLVGRTALITGGNTGIGAAAARLFAEEGAAVVVAARREAQGKQVVSDIEHAGGKAAFVRTDVSSMEDCKAMVEATLELYGKLDIAFNNAGVSQFGTSVAELDESEWDRVMAVNLKGVYASMKYEIPAILAAGGGSIVNMSSVGGIVASPGLSAYQASKHGVIGLTRSAALELATSGVRVNTLCPGGTMSEMFANWTSNSEVAEQVLAAHPMGRFADPIEPARAALFLASEDSSFITGAVLPVDGGLTAH